MAKNGKGLTRAMSLLLNIHWSVIRTEASGQEGCHWTSVINSSFSVQNKNNNLSVNAEHLKATVAGGLQIPIF